MDLPEMNPDLPKVGLHADFDEETSTGYVVDLSDGHRLVNIDMSRPAGELLASLLFAALHAYTHQCGGMIHEVGEKSSLN